MATEDKKPSLGERARISIANSRIVPWHRTGSLAGPLLLLNRRGLLEKLNLFPPPLDPNEHGEPTADPPAHRTDDGKGNKASSPNDGAFGTPFGRNMPVGERNPNRGPPVQLVAQKLLARRQFVPAGDQFNVLAAAWIQAMTHDWFGHFDDPSPGGQVTLDKGAESGCPMASFQFRRTLERPNDREHNNFRTHWWDASFVYGQNAEQVAKARTFQGGKLKTSNRNGLPTDENGVAVVGDNRNGWAGVALLAEVFLKEHNMVAEEIARHHPEYDDEKLFRLARLVVSAVVAKIHTVDWTVELLKTKILKRAMNINWFGVGKAYGLPSFLGGKGPPGLLSLVGQKTEDHGVPFCLTEEFVAVYRLHPMIPDGMYLGNRFLGFEKFVGKEGIETMSAPNADVELWDSMCRFPCGNLGLFNYPRVLRSIAPTDNGGNPTASPVDLAALDLYRDRERGIHRYNEFRRRLNMRPFKNWKDLTGGDKTAIEALTEVYGEDGIEDCDLQVGLLAEKKIKGFAISETAFVIFIVMASRRLEADRFFTVDYNEKTYSKVGLDWVNNTSSMRDVLERHYPSVAKNIPEAQSAFTPREQWPRAVARLGSPAEP